MQVSCTALIVKLIYLFQVLYFPGCSKLPTTWTDKGLLPINNENNLNLNHGDTVCLSCSDQNKVLVGDKCPMCNVYTIQNFSFTTEPSCQVNRGELAITKVNA